MGGGKQYDYKECFRLIKPLIEAADMAIGNLEVTLGGEPYTGYPCFCSPDEYLYAIKEAGFDVLTTANNHCCDTRGKGIVRTIKMLDSLNIPHCGTYTSAKEREKKYPLLLNVKGIRLALLNFTYDTNGLPIDTPNVVNLIDTTEIKKDIEKAKGMNPDVIIAMPHWGEEYILKENAQQRKLAEWMLSQGVNHIVGGHPHVVQPYYKQKDAKGEEHLVAYSLGNVISNMTRQVTNGGLMLTIQLQKTTAAPAADGTLDDVKTKTRLVSVKPELIFNSRPMHNGKGFYRVIPESAPDSILTPTERTARTAFNKLGHSVIDLKKKPEQHKPFP